TSSKIWLVLLLMWFVMLQVAAAEEANEAQERRLDVVSSLKKKQLYSLLDLLNTIGQQEQHLNRIPHDFVALVKTTVYMQTPLCCLVLLYGVLHLNCCSTLFQKCFGAKANLYSEINEEEFEMVEIEHDGETTDRDVIVNF
ncbi:hypothetical protein IRJ41_020480, partial [Triplophysa rosa]